MRKNNTKTSVKKLSKEFMIESLKLPGDVLSGESIVTLTGNREAWIENYRGIIEYTDSMILLQGKNCQICFEGISLSIDYYTNEDMKIKGSIKCINYR